MCQNEGACQTERKPRSFIVPEDKVVPILEMMDQERSRVGKYHIWKAIEAIFPIVAEDREAEWVLQQKGSALFVEEIIAD